MISDSVIPKGGTMQDTRAIIVDRATDLYTFIREVLRLPKGDSRASLLNQATEKFLHDVLALMERAV